MAGKLRITGGTLVRRLFQVPDEADRGDVRPSTDRIREAVFSSLGTQVQDARVLDLFAGSGASGFEALSRGAQDVLFVEKSLSTSKCIEENARSLGLDKQCQIITQDVLVFLAKTPNAFDLIFADPPFRMEVDGTFWFNLELFCHADTVVVFRCHKKSGFELPQGWGVVRQKAYGSSNVLFLKLEMVTNSRTDIKNIDGCA